MRLVLDNVKSGGMAVNSSKLLLSALVAALPLAAGAITVDGSYHEFLFNNVGTFAMGCAGGCVGTINPAAEETSTPPWTFSGPARVFVLDLFQIGDEFTLFDNNAVVGNTSTVANTGAVADELRWRRSLRHLNRRHVSRPPPSVSPAAAVAPAHRGCTPACRRCWR